jgi:hypothetical protein
MRWERNRQKENFDSCDEIKYHYGLIMVVCIKMAKKEETDRKTVDENEIRGKIHGKKMLKLATNSWEREMNWKTRL